MGTNAKVTYEQIEKANATLTGIDVKGKNYVMVPQRVKAFRMLYPEGFIKTDLLSLSDGVCVMKTEVGYYENGTPIVLGTGMAYERETSSYINKTSYIENCETSSVGRALGFLALGIDGGGICSAEELANAISNQNRNDAPQTNRTPVPAAVNTSARVPAQKQPEAAETPKLNVTGYIKNEIARMSEMFELPPEEMTSKFIEMRAALVKAGIIPDVKSKDQTMEQAQTMIEAMYKTFTPSGKMKK